MSDLKPWERDAPKPWERTFDYNNPPEVSTAPSSSDAFKLGTIQGATLDLADEGVGAFKTAQDLFKGASIKDTLDIYRKNRDAERQTYGEARQANPVAFGAGQVTGAVGSAFIPGLGWLNAVKGAKMLQAVKAGATAGAVQGFGASESDISKGDFKGVAKDTATGATVGAGTAGFFKSLPTIGKHLVIGGKDAKIANKLASKVGSIFTDTSEPDINKWLNLGFKNRNIARKFNPEEAAHALKPALQEMEDVTNSAIQSSYKRAKDEFLTPAATPEAFAQDKNAVINTMNDLFSLENAATQRKNLYSSQVRKEASLNVRDLIEKGSPNPAARAEEVYGGGNAILNLNELDYDNPEVISLLKQRILEAKQYLSKSKVGDRFDNLSVKDKELFNDTYQALNKNLKTASNGDKLAAADLLYSGDKTAENIGLFDIRDKFFGSMKTRKDYDTQKISTLMKTQTGKKLDFDDRLNDFVGFLEKNVDDPSWKPVVDKLNSFRTTADVRALGNKMKYDTGGPSSQAILNTAHAGAAYGTSGLSLLAYPFTNPVGYTRMVDRLGTETSATVAKAMQQAAGMGTRTLLLTDTYLKKKYPEYDAYLKEEKAKTPNLKEVSRGIQ